MKHKREILFHILGSRILVVLLALAIESLTARLLPVAERGRFSAIASAIILISQLSTLGFEYGFMLLDRLPTRAEILGAYSKALPICLFCSSLPFLFLRGRLELDFGMTMIVLGIQWMEVTSLLLLPVVLQFVGAKQFGTVRIARRLLFAIALLVLFIVPRDQSVSLFECLIAYAGGWALGLFLLIQFVFTRLSDSGLADGDNVGIRFMDLARPGFGIFIAKFAERSQSKIGVLLLGLLSANRAAGLFSIVAIALDLAVFVASSTSIAVLTRREGGRMIESDNLVQMSLLLTAVSALAAGIAFWLAPWAVVGAFGEDYSEASSFLRMALPAMVVYSSFPLVSTHLYSTGRRSSVLIGTYGGLMANAVVLLVFLDDGPLNDAFAATLGLILGALVSYGLVIVCLVVEGRVVRRRIGK